MKRRHLARKPATAIMLALAVLAGACTPPGATPTPAGTSAARPSDGVVARAPTDAPDPTSTPAATVSTPSTTEA